MLSTGKLPAAGTQAAADATSPITASVTVINTGKIMSDEVVQVYSNWTVTEAVGFRVPVRQLVGFTRAHAVTPGERRVVKVVLKAKDFALVNSDGRRVLPVGAVTLSVGGSQPTLFSVAAGAAPGVSQRVAVG